MDAAWHYHEAERLLALATTRGEVGSPEQESLYGQAVIHARLAGTAVLVDVFRDELTEDAEAKWRRVLDTRLLGGDPA
ncbi:MAG: hypothetical protein M3460_10925 [Actinomycetota bacterium]|nr:hypothetical protein [Actinomycetota bacterium]